MRCLAALAVAMLLAGCGVEPGGRGGSAKGDRLAIYASMPLHGPSVALARDVVDGAELALAQAGRRAGGRAIKFAVFDATDRRAGWKPNRVAGNARRAVQRDDAIAYLGELDQGASAYSAPILNAAGILQVTPTDARTARAARSGSRAAALAPAGDRTLALAPAPGSGAADAAAFAARFGRPASAAALRGAAAMRAILRAIGAAGRHPDRRGAVLAAFFRQAAS